MHPFLLLDVFICTMKRYITTLLLTLLSAILCGFSQSQQTHVYRDLGEYVYNMPNGDKIGVRAYILKTRNTNINNPYKNIFTLVAHSTSISSGQLTDTWLYQTRVFLNGVEVSFNQFPEGCTVFLSTSQTSVYYWFTNDEDVGKYYLTWASSAYVSR